MNVCELLLIVRVTIPDKSPQKIIKSGKSYDISQEIIIGTLDNKEIKKCCTHIATNRKGKC